MSHLMTAIAMKQTGLKPAAKIVLYWLAEHYNGETGLCYPSISTLSDECEMGTGTVSRHLADLENRGIISRTKRFRENGSKTSTEYELHFDPISTKRVDPMPQNGATIKTGQTDAPKRGNPCPKMGQAHAPNWGDHNLGTLNLGNEPESLPEFDQFLEISPSKEGLAKARVAFNEAREKVSFETLIDSMQAYREACERKKTKERYILHPANWLIDERWTDEPDQPCAKSPAAKSAAISAATLKYYADILNGNEPIHPSLISSSLARELYESGEVTAEVLQARLPA